MAAQRDIWLLTVDGDDEPAVEEAVSAFAGGLGGEQAGVAGGAVQAVLWLEWSVLGAQGVGGAALGVGERGVQQPVGLGGFAESDQPAKGSFAVAGGGVEQDPGLVSFGVGVDAHGPPRSLTSLVMPMTEWQVRPRSSSPSPSSSTLDKVIKVCPSPAPVALTSNGMAVGRISVTNPGRLLSPDTYSVGLQSWSASASCQSACTAVPSGKTWSSRLCTSSNTVTVRRNASHEASSPRTRGSSETPAATVSSSPLDTDSHSGLPPFNLMSGLYCHRPLP